MEFITQFFQALKSPKMALVLFLFSGALLFVPIERLGLQQPEFTEAYQTQILLVFFSGCQTGRGQWRRPLL